MFSANERLNTAYLPPSDNIPAETMLDGRYHQDPRTRGTPVPLEEPSTASTGDISRLIRLPSWARVSQRGRHLKAEHSFELITDPHLLCDCHHTQFIAAKVSTTGRLLTLMRPMLG
jgi:hypothetical protein